MVGLRALCLAGPPEKAPTLTHDEHRAVIAKTIEWAKERGQATIMAGTGSNSTAEAVELTKSAANDGADCALVSESLLQ